MRYLLYQAARSAGDKWLELDSRGDLHHPVSTALKEGAEALISDRVVVDGGERPLQWIGHYSSDFKVLALLMEKELLCYAEGFAQSVPAREGSGKVWVRSPLVRACPPRFADWAQMQRDLTIAWGSGHPPFVTAPRR